MYVCMKGTDVFTNSQWRSSLVVSILAVRRREKISRNMSRAQKLFDPSAYLRYLVSSVTLLFLLRLVIRSPVPNLEFYRTSY